LKSPSNAYLIENGSLSSLNHKMAKSPSNRDLYSPIFEAISVSKPLNY
jgi:hypothetical protein